MLARSKNKMSCVHRDLKPANLMLGGIPHDSIDLRLAGELGVMKIAGASVKLRTATVTCQAALCSNDLQDLLFSAYIS